MRPPAPGESGGKLRERAVGSPWDLSTLTPTTGSRCLIPAGRTRPAVAYGRRVTEPRRLTVEPIHVDDALGFAVALAQTPPPEVDRLAELRAALTLAEDRVLLANADEYDRMFESACRLIGSWPRADIAAPSPDLRPESGTWEPVKPPWALWLLTFAVTAAACVWARLQLPEAP